MTKRFLIAALAVASALPLFAQGEPICDAANAAAETARGQLTSARDALKAAAKAGQSDTELDTLAAAAGVVEGRLAGIHAKAFARFYALLTAEQKTKYDQLGTRAGSGRGPGRP